MLRGIRGMPAGAWQAWKVLISVAGGLAFFRILFLRISSKHIRRITTLEILRPCVFSFFDIKSYLMMALMITMGAIAREESRGSHYRMDDPSRDDVHWLKHTLFKKEGEEIRTGYEPVRIIHFQPERRAY